MTGFLLGLARLCRAALLFALGCGALAVVAALALFWRLAQGPVDLGWALPRLEAALARPGTPTRPEVGGASVSWSGFTGGPERDLEVRLNGLTVRDRSAPAGTAPVLRVNRLEVSLAASGLLGLRALPRAVDAQGVSVRLRRAADGAVALDLRDPDAAGADGAPEGGTPDLAEVVRELARPPRAAGAGPVRSALQALQTLGRIQVTDAAVTLHDLELGGWWRLDVARLGLERRAEGGVQGGAEAALSLGATRARLSLLAELAPNGGTSVEVTLAPVAATSLQRAAEAQGAEMGDRPVLDTALSGTARLLLRPDLQPERATASLAAGGGRVRVAGTEIGFDGVWLDAEAEWDTPGWGRPSAVSVSRLKAVVHAPGGTWPSTLVGSGTVRRRGELLSGTVTAALDHLVFTDLGRLWPERLGGHVRPWLVKNVTAGTARNGTVSAGFTATTGLADFVLTEVDASLAGDDTTIQWLPPVQPVEHAQALLRIRSPDVLDISVSSARQGGAALSNGLIHISGLTVKDQFLTLTADAAGTVPDLLALLRNPKLQLLSRKPIPMRNPGGSYTGHLSVFLPLNDDLEFDDVRIGARARVTDLRLGGLVAGRDLDHGDVAVEASSDAFRAQGRATVSGIPADLLVEMDFRNGGPAQVVQRAQAVARTGPAALAGAGLDTAGIIESGQGVFTARYQQRRDGGAELAVAADLKDAALGLAGWHKAAGPAADASGRLVLRGDQVVGLDQIRAQGPGLGVDGRAEMVGNRPLLLRLDRVVLGGTQGAGEVQLPGRAGEAIRARLAGPVLDLSALLARKGGGGGDDAPFVADVRFDRVLLAAGNRGLQGVTAHAESQGGRLVALRATSAGPDKVDATIERTAGGRSLHVTAADGGAVLRAMDLVDSVQGGAMDLRGSYDDRAPGEPPLRGTLELDGFRVRNAPGLGKLLQAVTVYGLLDALSGPGLSFSRLSMPFRWDGTVLEVADVQAFSASLGLTARGTVDSVRKVVDLRGTVVPLYLVNSMLGRIPLVGKLFSAEKGGGLLAVNYALRGPAGDPSVSVNPLSALTPGFLRGLFR